MAGIIKIISDSARLYRRNWRQIALAFVVMLIVSTVFQLIHPFLAVVSYIVSQTITLALIRPLRELSEAKPASDWKSHLHPQLLNALKIIVFTISLYLLFALPLIVFLVSKPTVGGEDVFIAVSLSLFTVAALIISSLLLTFMHVEIVLTGKGLVNAVRKSYSLAKSNLKPVIVYAVIWLAVSIALTIPIILASKVSNFLAIPLVLLQTLVASPIQLLSLVILWSDLKTKSEPATQQQTKNKNL